MCPAKVAAPSQMPSIISCNALPRHYAKYEVKQNTYLGEMMIALLVSNPLPVFIHSGILDTLIILSKLVIPL